MRVASKGKRKGVQEINDDDEVLGRERERNTNRSCNMILLMRRIHLVLEQGGRSSRGYESEEEKGRREEGKRQEIYQSSYLAALTRYTFLDASTSLEKAEREGAV